MVTKYCADKLSHITPDDMTECGAPGVSLKDHKAGERGACCFIYRIHRQIGIMPAPEGMVDSLTSFLKDNIIHWLMNHSREEASIAYNQWVDLYKAGKA